MHRSENEILADVKKLGVEYYEVTGKPLGVTGEIAEFEAAEKLGLDLSEARTEGYDATRPGPSRKSRRRAPAETPHEIAYIKWRRAQVQTELAERNQATSER